MLEVLGTKIDNPKEAVQLFRNYSTREILQAELKLVKVKKKLNKKTFMYNYLI